MRVSLSVVADETVPPKLVDGEGPEDGEGVVNLVVVADPRTDQSPSCFPGGVSTESGDLGGLAACA